MSIHAHFRKLAEHLIVLFSGKKLVSVGPKQGLPGSEIYEIRLTALKLEQLWLEMRQLEIALRGEPVSDVFAEGIQERRIAVLQEENRRLHLLLSTLYDLATGAMPMGDSDTERLGLVVQFIEGEL